MMPLRRKITAFSIVELVSVLAVVSMLVLMLLPAMQVVRESARNTQCKENLRQQTIALHNYEGQFGFLPPGTLGFMKLLSNVSNDDWMSNPSSANYWANAQHSSFQMLLLPFLDFNQLYEALPADAMNIRQQLPWKGDTQEFQRVGVQSVATYLCPSDNSFDLQFPGSDEQGWHVSLATQPGLYTTGANVLTDGFGWYPGAARDFGRFGASNYAGCSGAHSGVAPSRYPPGYQGAMASRFPVRNRDIRDGLSQSVALGENIGTIWRGDRKVKRVWAFGGLARGRGEPDWGQSHAFDFPYYIFGDWRYSSNNGFGSKHPEVVNVSFADGSIKSVGRAVNVWAWYGMCGIQDGTLTLSDE